MVDLFYHKSLQFSRGALAAPLMADSLVLQQKSLKKTILQQQQQETTTMQQLMLKHFRAVSNQTQFYSLPRSVLSQTPVEDLRTAACASVARRGDNAPALLPLSDRPCAAQLPALQDLGVGPQGVSQALCEQPSISIELQSDDDTFAPLPAQGDLQPQQQLCLPKLQIIQDPRTEPCWPDGKELLFFRITHISVNSLKRPLQSLDNIRPDDLALRFYDVVEVSETGDQVQIAPRDDVTVCASSLFTDWQEGPNSGASAQMMFSALQQWDVQQDVLIKQRS